MNLIEKSLLLKETALFASLELELLLTIAEKLTRQPCQPGQLLFPYGAEANLLYLIAGGEVDIESESGENIITLRRGEIFGDEALLNEQPRSYQATCRSETHLLTLTRTHLLTILSEFPTVALAFLQAYSRNISFRFR